MAGRESYGGGGNGGELDRNQTPTSLGFRTDGMYKPVMPPSIPTSNDDNSNNNMFHHMSLHHHRPDMMSLPGGVNMGVSIGGIDGINMNNTEPLKRKRGRPRKYSPPLNNNGIGGLDLTSPPPQQSPLLYSNNSSQSGGGFQSPPSPSAKKSRGRPLGSTKKNPPHPYGSSGGSGFTPHVITVKAGENVLSTIMSFSQVGPRGVCVLSAHGTISNVTLQQAATSGGTVTYEGRFDIVSLSGSFLPSENGGPRGRTGGLSVVLCGPDGSILGGGVAGLMTALTNVQIIVGSFITEENRGSKMWMNQQSEIMSSQGLSVAASPPSRGTFSESSGGPGSPPNNSTNGSGMLNMPWK